MKNFSQKLFLILSAAIILSALTGCSIDSRIKQKSNENNIVFVLLNNSDLENISPDNKELFPEIIFTYRSKESGIYYSFSRSIDSSEFFMKNGYEFFITYKDEYLPNSHAVEVFISLFICNINHCLL